MTRPHGQASRLGIPALALTIALVAAACSAAATPAPTAAPTATPAPTAAATVAPTPTPAKGLVNVAQDARLGAYLTGADGRSLYLFTKDTKDTSTATAQVLANWPPLLVTAASQATGGAGVTGTFGTTRLADGSTQVTYNGVPLYYFAKDARAGDVNGQGVNGVWFLATPASTAASGAPKGGIGQDAAATTPAASPAATTSGAATTVDIRNTAFATASVKVAVGATVRWTNSDVAGHTVTADNGSFDSKDIAGGGSYSHTFTAAGTVSYKCTIHPEMTGTVIVGG